MKRPAPYAGANANIYTASEMPHMSAQRKQQNTQMNNFPGRPDSISSEQGHPYWQWDRAAPNVLDPASRAEGHGSNTAQSIPQGQTVDRNVDLENRIDCDPGFHSHEQDMEIGYEDKPSPLTFEALEHKFQSEILKLVKEQIDAEEAENVRHKEKIIEINTQYQEKLSSLRGRQASRREEFLCKESQERLQKYRQAGMSDHQNRPGSIDPRGYGGVAVAEAPRSYGTGQYDFYRERPPSVGGGRSLETKGRVPFPEGRVYNNARARYY